MVGSSFVGFQGDPWISIHIDDLGPTTNDTVTLHEAMGVSISQLFYGKVVTSKETEVPNKAQLTSDTPRRQVEQILPSLSSGTDFEGGSGPHTPPPVEGNLSHFHTQFRRLHGCIQPAVSRLHESAKNKERATNRVAILVSLIPRNPSLPTGERSLCVYSHILINNKLNT